jgi:hypothetical protein
MLLAARPARWHWEVDQVVKIVVRRWRVRSDVTLLACRIFRFVRPAAI